MVNHRQGKTCRFLVKAAQCALLQSQDDCWHYPTCPMDTFDQIRYLAQLLAIRRREANVFQLHGSMLAHRPGLHKRQACSLTPKANLSAYGCPSAARSNCYLSACMKTLQE